ncbi:MAG: UUP1 family membrane protein [Candidatus Binatia bacterium]|nr:UUP1 family membrane protein [Candidatus Binatia bacterium]
MRSARVALTTLVAILLFIGTGMTLYQVFVLGLPLEPGTSQELWTVEAQIGFRARAGQPVLAQLQIPALRGDLVELSESFVSRNYGVSVEVAGPNRKVLWSIRRASGDQALYYRVALGPRVGITPASASAPSTVTPPELEGAEQVAVQTLLEVIRSQSANIRTFTAETIRRLNDRDDDNARILVGRTSSPLAVARAAVLVLNSARIPAHLVHALPLREGTRIDPEVLVASHNGAKWAYYEPITAGRSDPNDVLVWWQGDEPLLSVEGGSQPHVSFSIAEESAPTLALADEVGHRRSSGWIEFSLLSLPLQTQQLYQVLFVLPVGVGIIVLLRVFVGIETFGTFMPALIALAFRETELLWGMLLFGLLLVIGMTIRAALDQLKLLLVSRLAVMLTLVVLAMAGISVVSHRLGIERGLSVALFPMVIIAMTIERMSITWEERGGPRAFLVALGSLFAAALAYLAMTNPTVTHLVVTFPGTLLILVALLLLAGSYRGYRLMELTRFRAFGGRV